MAGFSGSVALFAGMLAGMPAAQSTAEQSRRWTVPACTIEEVSRRPLEVEGGLELYVEPVAFAVSGQRVLLAGTPNYLWARMADGSARRVGRDSVFGAVILEDGRAHTIQSPIRAGLVNGVRALPRDDGGWDIVFAELKPWSTFPPPDTAVRLWHGVYDGREWTSLTRVPVPPGTVLHPFHASPLVRRGDTLTWAVIVTGGDRERHVAVFEHQRGVWSHKVVPTGTAAYVGLVHSDRSGLLLAVVQPDSSRQSDIGSLFLYRRHGERRKLGPSVGGAASPIENLVSDPDPRRGKLGWIATTPSFGRSTQVAYTLSGIADDSAARVVSLGLAGDELYSVSRPGGEHFWAMDASSPEVGRVIRFVRDDQGVAVEIGSMAHPFYGGFNVAAPAASELLLTGPITDDKRTSVTSLLLRVRLVCPLRR